MSKISTYLTALQAEHIAQFCAQQIELCLGYLSGSNTDSLYSSLSIEDLDPQYHQEIQTLVEKFKSHPQEFSCQALIAKGQDIAQATQNLARIEVRTIEGVQGAAQVAARGVPGVFRQAVVALWNEKMASQFPQIHMRTAGYMSFEFNVMGVDKSLPFRYLNQYWSEVLERMQYTSGSKLDVFMSRQLLAADGDKTTYSRPYFGAKADLKASPAYTELIEFLELGGVYCVISGNSIDRVQQRIGDDIPEHLKSRFLIVANGGADLALYNSQGLWQVDAHYRSEALSCNKLNKLDLDVVYIGDDAKSDGNDYPAYNIVGAERSVVVSEVEPEDGLSICSSWIGGFEQGTAAFLKQLNQVIQTQDQRCFSESLIEDIRSKVRV